MAVVTAVDVVAERRQLRPPQQQTRKLMTEGKMGIHREDQRERDLEANHVDLGL